MPPVLPGYSGAGWGGRCCPQVLGVRPHRDSRPVTSAGVDLLRWLNELIKGRPAKLAKLSQLVSGPGSGGVTGSGAPDGAERSVWGLEVKSEIATVLRLGQTQIQEAAWGQSWTLDRCSFPLGSEEEPRLCF